MTTHLDRLLFAQGGLCFFCRQPLPKAEASVEHLVATANGGNNEEGNCVACCKTLNHLLGSRSIKEKLQIVLNQRGDFQCPQGSFSRPETRPVWQPPADEGEIPRLVDQVLGSLERLGAGRPKKVSSLTNTIKTVLRDEDEQQSPAKVARLISELQRLGYLTISGSKVNYLARRVAADNWGAPDDGWDDYWEMAQADTFCFDSEDEREADYNRYLAAISSGDLDAEIPQV